MKYLVIFLFFISFSVRAALSDSACATAIVNQLKSANPNLTGNAEAQAISSWTLICSGINTYIRANADINLVAGDITVPALGLTTTVGPVSGAALNAPSILSGRIQ